ncbi:MAG: response regulator [Actinomycetota bacterium]
MREGREVAAADLENVGRLAAWHGHGHPSIPFRRSGRRHPVDLNLPDVSGEEVLKQLKADPATRAIPVVIVSADASDGMARKLLAAGARDYITKPFDVPRFIQTVDEIFAAG